MSPAPPEGRPLHLGLVGFGRLARHYYLPALRRLPAVGRLSVADPAPSARAAAQRLLPRAAVLADGGALLERQRPDGLLVASPPSTHLAVWRQAAARGVPVFMEKPFLLAPELDRVNPADRSWAALMVDFNRRFWPGYERIARLIRAGAVGRPLQAALTLQASVLAWSPAGGHRLAEGEGGVLYDLGSHVLDLAAFMFCESPSTLAALRRAPPGTREAVDLRLEFASGLVAECRLAYAKKNRESVWIRGAAGALRLDDPNFLVWGERRAGLGPLTAPCNLAALAWRAVFRSRSMLRYSIARALAQFVTCMQSRTEFHPGFAEAYRVARWLRTAAASLETGQAGPLA